MSARVVLRGRLPVVLSLRLASPSPLIVLALALIFAMAAVAPASAYMALLRQGAETAEVPNVQDHYGDRIATGDFNNDGFEDIAVAAPDEGNDVGGGGDHGVVIVSYGSAAGIVFGGASVLSVGAPDDFNVYFGKGLAAGDFDGDGVDDLAVGVPGLDTVTQVDVGGVWVYAGIDGVGISLAPYIQLDQADCGATVENGDQFGYTLCAGDMGGDGFDDLFVGSIGEDNDAGLVAFFPGSAGGVTPTGSGFAKQSSLGGVDGAGDLFGYSLALGDFIDDGNLDLAIGAPYADEGSLLDMGKVYVVRGTALGPVVTGGEIHTPLSLGVPVQLGRAFGWSLAAGVFLDQNGVRPDLAIGEPLFYTDNVPTSGRVVVVDYDAAVDGVPIAPVVLDQAALYEEVNGGAAFGWSLASGNMLRSGGTVGPDGYDDLAIGAPNDDIPVPGATEAIYWSGVGTAYLVPGRQDSFAATATKVIDALERNDWWFSFDEKLGWSLAFGKFDDTGYDHLAIGVPNKTYPAFIPVDTEVVEAGQVHIMAPWRQPSGRPHRSAVVFDCADRILYAQRMKQRLTPASTTKALTALIAAEAMQDDPALGQTMFTVPTWCANDVTGSQYGLFALEQISFEDLTHTMISVSGNDCSYTIGNILTGEDNVWDYNESTGWNLENILSDFAAIMNARATQLGMSSAHTFNNPAGRPYGDHWTTAHDMAIFVSGAMPNPVFREIVGTKTWNDIFRLVPINQLLPWLPPSPGIIPLNMSSTNWFYDGIKDRDPRATGVKGGWNSISQTTGLYSAELDNGWAKVTIFGVPPYGALADLGAELLSLVADDCVPQPLIPAVPVPDPSTEARRIEIPVDDGEAGAVMAEIDPTDPENRCVSILRGTVVSPTVCLYAKIKRDTQFDIAMGETRTFGSAAGTSAREMGVTLTNGGDSHTFRGQVQWLAAGVTEDIVLQPGESWIRPMQAVPAGQDGMDLLIVNNGDGSDYLELQECYGYQLVLGQDRTTPPDWKAVLTRNGIYHRDAIDVSVLGCDPPAGDTVSVTVHSTLTGTAVPDDGLPPTRDLESIASVEVYPNPFNPKTSVSFDLRREASVSLRIYDRAGRLVRTLEASRSYPAGTHRVSWNGTDDLGRGVASGVYLLQLSDGTASVTQRMTLLK